MWTLELNVFSMECMFWLSEYLNIKFDESTKFANCSLLDVYITSNYRELYMGNISKFVPISKKLGKGVSRMYLTSCTDGPCCGVCNLDLLNLDL